MVALARIFQNSPQIFVLNGIIKSGLITVDLNLNFDEKGKIKENYEIEGSVKKAKLDILNKFKLQDLNLDFSLKKNTYSLTQIDMRLNNIKVASSLIEVKKKINLFFVSGEFLNDKKVFDIKELKLFFPGLYNNIDIQKIEFSSKNNFSFDVSKNLKFDNFKIVSTVHLNELIFKEKRLNLIRPYLPSFVEEMKLEEHKVIINYNRNKFDIKGYGNILLEDKLDNLSYQVIKDNDNISFDSKINIKNNSLILNFLDYKKEENRNSLVLIKGNFEKDNKIKFDLIDFNEKDNRILIKGLELNKNFKIIDIENFQINYKNNNENLNKINLKKIDSIFFIDGESFDALRIINNIMDNDQQNQSFFQSLSSKIKIRIKKTYIDDINYINNLYGYISFNKNKITDLTLESTFTNNKKINLSIKTNNNSEILTKLSTSYPKPLIKRYNFIKGFEEGNLVFNSTKQGGISNSVLIIDNFKVKEVPIFAKLLSLASLQGMADLLTGEGIRFTDFEMNFSNENGLTTIEEMYAIGPAVSIIMDGYIETKKLVSLRGTLVPATTINRTIASIPLLGKILVGGKPGEGVFGVSFKIKGKPKDLKTTVNPVKTLTPRFISRTLEKIKKN